MYRLSSTKVIGLAILGVVVSVLSPAQAQVPASTPAPTPAGTGYSSQIDFSWAPNPTAIKDASGKDWSHSDFCAVSHVLLSYFQETAGSCSVYYDHTKRGWMMQSGPNQGWQQCTATCWKK